MNTEELIAHAERYLKKYKIRYVPPGRIGEIENKRVEVIFWVPEALNPKAVVDPPDVRLWVDTTTGRIEVIDQM
jgi:hypothetical protein